MHDAASCVVVSGRDGWVRVRIEGVGCTVGGGVQEPWRLVEKVSQSALSVEEVEEVSQSALSMEEVEKVAKVSQSALSVETVGEGSNSALSVEEVEKMGKGSQSALSVEELTRSALLVAA
jgi:hypothetical protein